MDRVMQQGGIDKSPVAIAYKSENRGSKSWSTKRISMTRCTCRSPEWKRHFRRRLKLCRAQNSISRRQSPGARASPNRAAGSST